MAVHSGILQLAYAKDMQCATQWVAGDDVGEVGMLATI